MIKFNPIKTTDPSYPFVENLLHESFPVEERRDDEMQRYNTDSNPLFTAYLITDDAENVGLITLWKLTGFLYVEHLATSPSVRNKGYGKMIMQALLSNFPDSIIVLEVELPEDEMAVRRIGFYRRNGFHLWDNVPYLQPSYGEGREPVPLCLMTAGDITFDGENDEKIRRIKREVYGVAE